MPVLTFHPNGFADHIRISVTPWFAAPVRLPDIHRVTERRSDDAEFRDVVDETRHRVGQSERLERVLDHVAGWHGLTAAGVPMACSRAAARALVRAMPGLLEDLERAINDATASGVLS